MKYLLEDIHYKALAEHDPQEVCKRVGCTYDATGESFTLTTWGENFQISVRESQILPSDSARNYHDYFYVFLINYLQMAREITPTEDWITEKDLPGGVTFFRGPHLLPTAMISDKYENDLDAFKERCLQFGGSPVSMGDAAYTFSITPSIPLLVIYWLGDEDFPAEAKILFDASMRDYLPLDIVYALAVEVCYRLGGKR